LLSRSLLTSDFSVAAKQIYIIIIIIKWQMADVFLCYVKAISVTAARPFRATYNSVNTLGLDAQENARRSICLISAIYKAG
jgi:hypothetical protein